MLPHKHEAAFYDLLFVVQNGAMELESAELQFETSAEGQATGVQTKQELPMMRTVAELMIHANSTVAARIQAAFPRAALLRRHPPPRPEVFAEVSFTSNTPRQIHNC